MPKGDDVKLKADTDDGYTPIANLLLEAVAIAPLSGVEKGAILALWRLTYGWTDGERRRTKAVISLPDWAQYLNTDKSWAQRVINQLVNKSIFLREDLGQGKGYQYAMNTRVGQWLEGSLIALGLANRYTPTGSKGKRRVVRSSYSTLKGEGLANTATEGLANRTTPSATNLASSKESLNKEKDINIYKDKDASSLWTAILGSLETQVSKSNYQTWLAKTEGLYYRAGKLCVGCPTDFVIDYLNKNQRSLIEKVAMEVAGGKVDVVLVKQEPAAEEAEAPI